MSNKEFCQKFMKELEVVLVSNSYFEDLLKGSYLALKNTLGLPWWRSG